MSENKNYRNLTADEDLMAGGSLRVRGKSLLEGDVALDNDLKIRGSANVDGNLKVKGILEAGDFIGMLKGLFPSESRLSTLYPHPRDGMTALVGNTLPAELFRAERRKWVATGELAGVMSLPLDSVNSRIDTESSDRQEADKLLSNRLDAVEDYFIYKNAYVYSYAPENERIGEDDLECTPYLVIPAQGEVAVTAYEHSDVCAPVTYFDENFHFLGRRTLGSNGVKELRSVCSSVPEGAVYMRVNALLGHGKVTLSDGTRLWGVDSATAARIREHRDTLATEMETQSRLVSLGVEEIDVTPAPDTYYNMRGVRKGDILKTIKPESTKVEGLYSACVSFEEPGRRLLRLTSSGTDLVRNYCALDSELRVVQISDDGDYTFTDRTVELPSSTRHILLQSFSVPLMATIYNPAAGGGGASESQIALMPHSGERWLLLGDSLFECRDSDGKGIGDYLAQLTGATVFDCGIGGARLTRRRETEGMTAPFDNNDCYAALDVVSVAEGLCSGDISLQQRVIEQLAANGDDNSRQLGDMKAAMTRDIGRVVILAGTNDYASEVDATTDNDSTVRSIYGAMSRIVERLQSKWPYAEILVCTPPPRMTDTSDPATFSDDYRMPGAVSKLPEIAETIKKAAGRWHLPVADLYNTLGWTRYNYAAQCVGNDGTHPLRGLRRIASFLAK